MLVIHNDRLLPQMRHIYTHNDALAIQDFLRKNDVFSFSRLHNGLFPASATHDNNISGYSNVWIRDNIFIAHSIYATNDKVSAAETLKSLFNFLNLQRNKFLRIIEDPTLAKINRNRPHVRFDGLHMQELHESWAHGQNDALGYFLWFTCLLAKENLINLSKNDIDLLLIIVEYFNSIRFWQDEDNGHWEEVAKISASSIGAALSGLILFREFIDTVDHHETDIPTNIIKMCDSLIAIGTNTLSAILPNECVQNDPMLNRKYDAALLFLIYPLNLQMLDAETVKEILNRTKKYLQGDFGVRRYLGDSYWFPNYKQYLPPETRTKDFSENIAQRDRFITVGQEAQWCIFDPIISCIYGNLYLADRSNSNYRNMCHHFNRALGQLTQDSSEFGGMKCPEAYYINENNYVPNDHTPLQWTQANLLQALQMVIRCSRVHDHSR